MKLNEILDVEKLSDHICNRLVGVQRHPSLPLKIYNYTQNAQFDPHWGDGTIDYCRGLIVDDQDNVIARPFKKFHNLNTEYIPETMEANLPKTTPTILEKYDGSLGILYRYEGEYGIATRGSFTSPQATWATKWLKDRVDGYVPARWEGVVCRVFANLLDTDVFTWLFEIIYAENRIVVQYPWEGLILLGAVTKNNGWEMPHGAVAEVGRKNGYRVARQVKDRNILGCMQDNNPNEEGYVVTYSLGPETSPLKVKIKMADYVRLHKIVTGMNARSVWERLSNGEGVDRLSSMPEHFKKWLFAWRDKLVHDYDEIYNRSKEIFERCPYRWVDENSPSEEQDREYRKQFAFYLQKEAPREYHSVLFAMLDNQDPSPVIWKMIKPRGDDQTFRTEGE